MGRFGRPTTTEAPAPPPPPACPACPVCPNPGTLTAVGRWAQWFYGAAALVCAASAVAYLLYSVVKAMVALAAARDKSSASLYARLDLTRAIALALDLLLVSDLISTLAVTTNGNDEVWQGAARVGLMLAVRCAIAYSRKVEFAHVSEEQQHARELAKRRAVDDYHSRVFHQQQQILPPTSPPPPGSRSSWQQAVIENASPNSPRSQSPALQPNRSPPSRGQANVSPPTTRGADGSARPGPLRNRSS